MPGSSACASPVEGSSHNRTFWLSDKCLSQRQHLLLTAAQVPCPHAKVLLENRKHRERVLDCLCEACLRDAMRGAKPQIVQHRKSWKHPMSVQYQPQAFVRHSFGPKSGNVFVSKRHTAGRWHDESTECA